MDKNVLLRLFAQIFPLMLSVIDEVMVKGFLDDMIDFLEEKVEKSENKWDDAAVLPVCKMFRDMFNIPDLED